MFYQMFHEYCKSHCNRWKSFYLWELCFSLVAQGLFGCNLEVKYASYVLARRSWLLLLLNSAAIRFCFCLEHQALQQAKVEHLAIRNYWNSLIGLCIGPHCALLYDTTALHLICRKFRAQGFFVVRWLTAWSHSWILAVSDYLHRDSRKNFGMRRESMRGTRQCFKTNFRLFIVPFCVTFSSFSQAVDFF